MVSREQVKTGKIPTVDHATLRHELNMNKNRARLVGKKAWN